MTKIIKRHPSKYTVVSNQLIEDKRLSWKAKGVFIYLWAQKADWNFYANEVAKHSTDGRDSLRSALAELEKYCYLTRKRERKGDGTYGAMDWVIDDLPKLGKPMSGEPMSENPMWDIPTLTSTNKNNDLQEQELNRTKEYSPAKAEPHLPFEEIVSFLNAKAGTKYRSSSAKTKSLIKARWHEGFRLDDFKTVIVKKSKEWLNTDMAKYLRPETLFGTKFEAYLNQKEGVDRSDPWSQHYE